MPSISYPPTFVTNSNAFNTYDLIDYPENSLKWSSNLSIHRTNEYIYNVYFKKLFCANNANMRCALGNDMLMELFVNFNNIGCHLRNHTKTLRYDRHNQTLYSYNEPIAYKEMFEGEEVIMVYNKSRKLKGEYFSMTTSSAVHKVIRTCSAFNVKYHIVNQVEQTLNDYISLSPDKKECSICLSNDDEDEYCSINGCNHTFHTKCLGIWYNTHKECPLCRGTINKPNSNSNITNLVASQLGLEVVEL